MLGCVLSNEFGNGGTPSMSLVSILRWYHQNREVQTSCLSQAPSPCDASRKILESPWLLVGESERMRSSLRAIEVEK